MSTTTRWVPGEKQGCIFAGASNRTADSLNACVILLAMEEGWEDHPPAVHQELKALAQATHGWCDEDDDSQWLSDEVRTAEEWLNEHVAPEGWAFQFDDGFYLWEIDEEEA
jgi:hypothetical protein